MIQSFLFYTSVNNTKNIVTFNYSACGINLFLVNFNGRYNISYIVATYNAIVNAL